MTRWDLLLDSRLSRCALWLLVGSPVLAWAGYWRWALVSAGVAVGWLAGAMAWAAAPGVTEAWRRARRTW